MQCTGDGPGGSGGGAGLVVQYHELHRIPAQGAVLEIQGAACKEGGYKHKGSPLGLQSLERCGDRPEGSVVVAFVGGEAGVQDVTTRAADVPDVPLSPCVSYFPSPSCPLIAVPPLVIYLVVWSCTRFLTSMPRFCPHFWPPFPYLTSCYMPYETCFECYCTLFPSGKPMWSGE